MKILDTISNLCAMVHVVIYFLLLYTPKYSFRRTSLMICSISVILLAVYTVFAVTLGTQYVVRLVILCCVIPSLILFYFLSKYRDGRFFFTFCLSDTLFYWILQATSLLDRLCGGGHVVLSISRLVLFPLFGVFLWRKVRRPYLELQVGLSNGWWMITAIAAGYYLMIAAFFIPVGSQMPEPIELLRLVLLLVMMPFTYFTILGSLHRQMLYYEAQNRQDILSAQVAGLQNQMSAVQAAEENVRIQRHDLRHQLLILLSMLEQGKNTDALEYIRTLEDHVEQIKLEKWCSNPILDAVFSSYFAQARQQEIRIQANLAIPEELPVDADELSIVFANALENAIHACACLPPERREITCTCICHPALMFEVENPYEGTICFDGYGRPTASRQGHGIGARSIAAFCEKYDACCSYEAENNWFRLKIAL